MNFLYQNNLPEDLKSKRSFASFAAKPWFTISRFLITGLCECLHSKQLELSKSFLENIETALIGLLCSLQSNPAPAVYGQRVNCFEFSTSSCRSLLHNFSCLVQKVISYKEQKLSQCTGKQNYVIKKKTTTTTTKNKNTLTIITWAAEKWSTSSRVGLLVF